MTLKVVSLKTKYILYLSVLVCLLSACGSSRLIPDNSYLLESVEIKTDDKRVDVSSLTPYIRQRANSKWFSLFKIPLGTYALAGNDLSLIHI